MTELWTLFVGSFILLLGLLTIFSNKFNDGKLASKTDNDFDEMKQPWEKKMSSYLGTNGYTRRFRRYISGLGLTFLGLIFLSFYIGVNFF